MREGEGERNSDRYADFTESSATRGCHDESEGVGNEYFPSLDISDVINRGVQHNTTP